MLETILFLTINCSFEEEKASDERTGNGNEFEWVVSSEDSRPSEDLFTIPVLRSWISRCSKAHALTLTE